MASPPRALVVFGSGPGIGRNVAAVFGEHGFDRIILLSRDKERLSEDVTFVREAAPSASVDGLPTDLADLEGVRTTLTNLGTLLTGCALECVLYNAARVGRSKLFSFESEDLERDFRVGCSFYRSMHGECRCAEVDYHQVSVTSLYEVAKWAMPQLEKTAITDEAKHPALLVTSGGLYKNPFPAFVSLHTLMRDRLQSLMYPQFALASCKAAQYSLVNSIHKEYSSKDVHAACIVVEGRVNDNAKVTTARHIAEETWKLFEQPRNEGELDISIQDPDYLEFIKKNS